MNRVYRIIPICLLILIMAIIASPNSYAQGTRGFNWRIQPNATNLELNDDHGHWAMEVIFKPMRLVRFNITDPKTGKKKEQLVWYLVYKAINRPLVKQDGSEDTKPINTEDEPHSKPYFIPEFTLVRNDNDGTDIYKDQVLPEAQKIILKRELRGKDANLKFKNSVEIIGTIPDPVEKGKEKTDDILYGIVTWTGVSPNTDQFTVYMTGFSSGYQKGKGPQGKEIILRRTIKQNFWRPGDEFDQDEIEFRRVKTEMLTMPGKTEKEEVDLPRWIYRPDPQVTE